MQPIEEYIDAEERYARLERHLAFGMVYQWVKPKSGVARILYEIMTTHAHKRKFHLAFPGPSGEDQLDMLCRGIRSLVASNSPHMVVVMKNTVLENRDAFTVDLRLESIVRPIPLRSCESGVHDFVHTPDARFIYCRRCGKSHALGSDEAKEPKCVD